MGENAERPAPGTGGPPGRSPEQDWRAAEGIDAQVARCPYVPRGWPEGTWCIARRVKVVCEDLRADKRTRRRRTIDPNQLRLLENGEADVAYAYSFIVTNVVGDPVEIKAWSRMRALVEERMCDSKAGMALRHLPSGFEAVKRTWIWSAFLALHCSVWLQGLAGVDTGPDGRAARQAAAPRADRRARPGPLPRPDARRAGRPRTPPRRLRRGVGRPSASQSAAGP